MIAIVPLYYVQLPYFMILTTVALVGLAVDDIKEVYNNAELKRAIMKIQLIFQVFSKEFFSIFEDVVSPRSY